MKPEKCDLAEFGLIDLIDWNLPVIDTLVANKNWDQLGQMLTAPNSIDIMVRIANTPAYQRNWRLLLSPLAKEGSLMENKEATQKKYENQFKGITQ